MGVTPIAPKGSKLPYYSFAEDVSLAFLLVSFFVGILCLAGFLLGGSLGLESPPPRW